MRPPALDWSEFHVWSPAGVFYRMQQEKGVKLWPTPARQITLKSMATSLARCAKCVKDGIQGAYGKRKGEQMSLNKARSETVPLKDTDLMHLAYIQFAAGALGGGTATYSTHWLDTVKVKMQTLPTVYQNGTIFCLKDTWRQEGIRGLYQGAAPAVVGQTAKTAVVFMSYGLCEELVRKMAGCADRREMTIWHHAAAGAMTGVAASFVLCPLELVKCRLQALQQVSVHYKSPLAGVTAKSRSPLSMVRYVLRQEGVPGLYRGLPGIWVKEVPGSFIYFGSYEMARSFFKGVSQTDHLPSRAVFLSGMFAGLCFCVTHPIESVKTRVQVVSAVSETKGFFRAARHILTTEGVGPLFSGLKPSMIRACLYSGIQFMMYEALKDFFLEER